MRYAALRGAFGSRSLPEVGTVVDEIYTVILCPVCRWKTLDQHDICRHCGWEYDGFDEDHVSAANGASLRAYREAYEETRRNSEGEDVSIL